MTTKYCRYVYIVICIERYMDKLLYEIITFILTYPPIPRLPRAHTGACAQAGCQAQARAQTQARARAQNQNRSQAQIRSLARARSLAWLRSQAQLQSQALAQSLAQLLGQNWALIPRRNWVTSSKKSLNLLLPEALLFPGLNPNPMKLPCRGFGTSAVGRSPTMTLYRTLLP